MLLLPWMVLPAGCTGTLTLGSLEGTWKAVAGPAPEGSVQVGRSELLLTEAAMVVWSAPEAWIRAGLRCQEGTATSLECDAEDGMGSRVRFVREDERLVLSLVSPAGSVPYGGWEPSRDPAVREKLAALPSNHEVCEQTRRCQEQALAALGQGPGMRPLDLAGKQAAGCFALRRHYAGKLLSAGASLPLECRPPPGAPPLEPVR